MDEVGGHHNLFSINLLHFFSSFLDFYQNSGDYLSSPMFDQHCSEGSKHFPVKSLFQRTVWRICVYVYIYILKYESSRLLFFFFFAFLPTTILFLSVEIISVEIGESRTG